MHESLCLAPITISGCGYYMSLKTCSTRPSAHLIFLGIVCRTDRRRFEAPETKMENLETLLKEAIQNRSITFHDLEKMAGKCTSISTADPPASLYT